MRLCNKLFFFLIHFVLLYTARITKSATCLWKRLLRSSCGGVQGPGSVDIRCRSAAVVRRWKVPTS
jgi:hypothetical protein